MQVTNFSPIFWESKLCLTPKKEPQVEMYKEYHLNMRLLEPPKRNEPDFSMRRRSNLIQQVLPLLVQTANYLPISFPSL